MYINHFFKHSACAQLIVAPFDNLIINSNLEASHMLGWSSEELEHKTIAELFQQSQPQFQDFAKDVLNSGKGWSEQLWLKGAHDTFNVETFAISSKVGEHVLFHLTMNRTDELLKLRNKNSQPAAQEPLPQPPANIEMQHKVLTANQLKQREQQNLIRAMQISQGRIFGPGGAAELLDLKPTTLCAKLKRHAIDRRQYLPSSAMRRA